MTQAQLRIIVELFLEGKTAYEERGYMENEENESMVESNYKKSVDNAQKVAFKVLRDAVEESETGRNKKEKEAMLRMLKICVLQLPEETSKEVLHLIDKIEEE
jgi:hypothetical protein